MKIFRHTERLAQTVTVSTLDSTIKVCYTHPLTSLVFISLHPSGCAVLIQSDLQIWKRFTLNTSLWLTLEPNICLQLFIF